MSTRTTSDVNSYHKWCQLVPDKTDIREWYELTSLITQQMSTRTHVSSYHSWMLTRTIIRCQLVPKLIPEDNECRLYIRAYLDVISSKLSCDFSKLTIAFIYLYIYSIIFMTNKTFLMSIKNLPVCLLPLCTNSLNYWIITSERGRNFFFFFKLEGQKGVRTCDLQPCNAPGPALYMNMVLHMLHMGH